MSILVPAPRKDSFVANHIPKKNFARSDSLFVGATNDPSAVFRSYLKFDLKGISSKALLQRAVLRLFIKRNEYPDSRKVLDIHLLAGRFKSEKLNWNNQPRYSPKIIATTEISNEAGEFVRWDITDLLRSWLSGEAKNRGILIKARDESQAALLSFDSRESPHQDRRPNLVISLDEPYTYAQSVRCFFSEAQTNLLTCDQFQFSLARDISKSFLNTFFVQNKGANPAAVVAQISPDNSESSWLDDSTAAIVNGGENFAVTSNHLARWTRLAYKSAIPGSPTSLTVWFQAES